MEKKDSTKEIKKKTPAKTGKKNTTSKGTAAKKEITNTKKATTKPKAATENKKEVVKEVVVKEEPKVESKQANTEMMDSTRKEILLTIAVLIMSIIVGFFIGKYLFELMY